MKCKDCPMFDIYHYEYYEEPICTEGDFTIRLKRGQGRPDNCPFRLEKNTDPIPDDLKQYLDLN